MALKHALSILSSRFSLTYKTLLYAMIIILLFVLIGVVVLVPMIKPLVSGMQEIGFFEHIKATFNNLISGNVAGQSELYPILKDDIVKIGELFSGNVASVAWSIVWVVIVIMLFKIVISMCYYPIADVVHNFMSYNSRFGFTSNFVSNLGISAKYACSEFLVSIPFYLIGCGIIFGVWYLLALFSPFVGIVVAFSSFVVLIAVKKALLSFWLPHLIYSKGKVWQTFKEQLPMMQKKFVKVFGLYVITNLLTFAFVLLFGLFTFTIGWFVGYAIAVVLYRIIDMVIYYRDQNHKYYIEPKTVIDAKSEII